MRNFFAGLSGGSGAFAAAGLCLVLVAAGFYVQSTRGAKDISAKLGLVDAPENTNPENTNPENTDVVQALAKPDEAEPAEVDPEATDTNTVEPAARTTDEPDQVVAETTSEEEPATTADTAPVFDEVRREADGVTVIAGQAMPGAIVSILQNGTIIARATADSKGKFATVALTPPDGKGHVLSLLQTLDGTETASLDEIILAPIAPLVAAIEEVVPTNEARGEGAEDVAGTEEAAVAKTQSDETKTTEAQAVKDAKLAAVDQPAVESGSEAAQDNSEDVVDAATNPEPSQSQAVTEALADPVTSAESATTPETPEKPETPDPASSQETASVAVLKSTAQGVELLNTPSPEAMTNVALDTISYSDVGEVELAGRAQSDTASVRVYLNNNSVINLPVDAQGRWRGELPDVDEGIYTLRVDEVSTSGQITSRVETPFKRESTQVLAAAAAAQDGPLKAITVQEGATLWAIARERYGDGALYVRVFEANSSAIRNPDLIYPGQIFDLPE